MPSLPAKIPSEKVVVADLYSWRGRVSRRKYLMLGAGLFGVKYGIDLLIAHLIFHRNWPIWAYLLPGQTLDFLNLSTTDRDFFFTIVTLALPFIWSGVVLTVRRLRDAGLPIVWAKVFFVPVINYFLFFILSLLPSDSNEDGRKEWLVKNDPKALERISDAEVVLASQEEPKPALTGAGFVVKKTSSHSPSRRFIADFKDSFVMDAAGAILLTGPATAAIVWFGTIFLQSYGWGLFVGLPFIAGMTTTALLCRTKYRSLTACLSVSTISITFLGICLLIFAWEGFGCIVMSSVIVIPLNLMGALLGYYMQRNRNVTAIERSFVVIGLLCLCPFLMGCEYAAHPEPVPIPVISTINIDAPPEEVWKHVIAFPRLPEPTELMFKLGIAYPIGATIDGEGVGAVRRCRFSTGAFVEPIKVWNAPNLLQFGVESQPATMREFSWNHEIQPAHLHGYLKVSNGQFKLIRQPGEGGAHDTTKLEGTTWYANRMWPNMYWNVWSNNIIHTIHMRVLRHIKQQSEAATPTN